MGIVPNSIFTLRCEVGGDFVELLPLFQLSEVLSMSKLRIVSDEKDTAEIVKSAIAAELKRLEIALNGTAKEIKKFEDKYRVSSDVFLTEFTAEDLQGGDEEYIRWAGEIKIRERILDDLQKLKDIEYVTN